jgi:nucleoside-triphosphatase
MKEIASALGPRRAKGFITEEVREGGERRGFRVALLHEAREGILARAGGPGPRVGKYGVDLASFEATVLPFLEAEVRPETVYLLDEVGKMECLSARFRAAVAGIIGSGAAAVATVPLRASGFPAEVKARGDLTIIPVSRANAVEVRSMILERLREKEPV